MLVLVGIPIGKAGDRAIGIAGTPALAAVAAVRAGAKVELVGKVGEDPSGDALVLALGQAGIGHVALLRDPGHATPIVADHVSEDVIDGEQSTEAAPEAIDRTSWPRLEAEDLQLALRYLPDVRAIVVAEPLPEAALRAVSEAASYLAAPLVVVAEPGTSPPADIVLAAPASDPEGAFAELLGQVGAALDRSVSVDEAFRDVSGRLGLSPASS